MYYVYRITNKEENKHYYGSRVSKDAQIEDLGVTYFSSSKDKAFILEQKSHPYKFKYKIVKVFENKSDTIQFESQLHKKFDVKNHTSFYNKSNQTMKGFDLQETSVCEYCQRVVSSGNYTKWHGLNCFKNKFKDDLDNLNRLEGIKCKVFCTILNKPIWILKATYDEKIHIKNFNHLTKIKNPSGGTMYISKNEYDSSIHTNLNSKKWIILDKCNNKVLEVFNFSNLGEYKLNIFIESFTYKTAITFLHERSQLNKAINTNILKYEGYKLISEREYLDNNYALYDGNRIKKILNGRNNVVYEIYNSNDILMHSILSMLKDRFYLTFLLRYLLHNEKVQFNKQHSSYTQLREKYFGYEGFYLKRRNLTSQDIKELEKDLILN